MKTTFVLLVSLVLSGSAYAGGPSHNQYQGQAQQGQSQGQNTSVRDTNVNANQNINLTRSNSDSNSRSNSDSSSRSTANGGTSAVLGSGNSDNHNAATGGSSSSTGGNSSVGNTSANGGSAQGGSAQGGSVGNTSTQGTVSNNNNYQQVRQAPSAYAPDALPSAPCRVSGSIGASSPVGGLSLGGSKLDTECDSRETARAFALLGNKLAAARILCDTKAAKKAQLTYQECANYAVGYFGGVQDGDGPGFTVPAGKGTPKQ